MFDYLVEANGLRPVMEEHGLVLPEDLDFIKEQIAGPLDTIAAKGKKVPISYSCIFVYVYLHAGVCVSAIHCYTITGETVSLCWDFC